MEVGTIFEIEISEVKTHRDMNEEFVTIHISCREFHLADFLRNLANTIEEEEHDNLHFENENGYADVIY